MLRIFSVLILSASLAVGNFASAQTVVDVPEDAKFVVQVDVGQFRDTRLGSKLLKLTQKMAQEEIGSDDDVMQQIEEALGFNPLEEIQTLTIIGTSFEDPEETLHVLLQMGKTTGNLEGMMLTLPNYSSDEQGGHTIHSAGDGDVRAFATIHQARDGNHVILASSNRSDLMDLLDSVKSGERSSGRGRKIRNAIPDGIFAQVQILEFPEEVLEHDPPGNIARMVKDVSVTLGEEGEDYAAHVVLTTDTEKRADQILQLAQGLKALVGLFEEEIGDDEEARMALSLLEKVSVERDGTTVTLRAAVPEALIIEFLQEEADLPL